MRTVAETEAAAADNATTIPATGIVLVSIVRIVRSGRLLRYWLTTRATISTRPTISGRSVTGPRKRWVSSSEAPKNAAAHPDAARPIATGSRGASRSAGGASSNVNSESRSAASEIPATIQNSGRHAWALPGSRRSTGPSATAPKMQTFMIIAVQRNFSKPKPSASGGTAAINSRLVHSPCSTCPAMNIAGSCAAATTIDPITSSTA